MGIGELTPPFSWMATLRFILGTCFVYKPCFPAFFQECNCFGHSEREKTSRGQDTRPSRAVAVYSRIAFGFNMTVFEFAANKKLEER